MNAFELMARLQAARIHFTLTTIRDGALMFEIAVPGERWEVEIFEDGRVEAECFSSYGEILRENAIIDLIASHMEVE